MITREDLLQRLTTLQESQRVLLNNLNAHVGAIGEIELLLKSFEATPNESVPDSPTSKKVVKG
jgi:hypothetical protein